jgi:hypothetical protein
LDRRGPKYDAAFKASQGLTLLEKYYYSTV